MRSIVIQTLAPAACCASITILRCQINRIRCWQKTTIDGVAMQIQLLQRHLLESF